MKYVSKKMNIIIPGGTLHLIGYGDEDAGDFLYEHTGPNDSGYQKFGLGRVWIVTGFTPCK